MNRKIVLDTETTGLDPQTGHRIIEIGCVELIGRKLTGNRFHTYLNPERDIDVGASEVHGLTMDFLKDKPRFQDVADDLVEFIQGAELVIHNAPFDVGFLNHEFGRLSGYSDIGSLCVVLDTLLLARQKHPGQRNSLDALCKRYNISNAHRTLHGALLDAEILAEVYLSMTGGQTSLQLDQDESAAPPPTAGGQIESANTETQGPMTRTRVIRSTPEELAAHQQRLDAIQKSSQGQCLWLKSQSPQQT